MNRLLKGLYDRMDLQNLTLTKSYIEKSIADLEQKLCKAQSKSDRKKLEALLADRCNRFTYVADRLWSMLDA